MDRMFRIETTLSADLAELYEGLMEEFDEKSDIGLAEMNRTLLQTGMIQHLTMMHGLGLVDEEKGERFLAIIDKLAKETIMWELVVIARRFWQDSASSAGAIDLKA